MEIVQKKRSNRHAFTFHEDHFNYAYEDKSGSGDADVAYADLPRKRSIQIERNDWLRNVGLLWIVIGIFQLGSALYAGTSVSGRGFWLLVGVVCVAWAHLSTRRYSVFSTEHGGIFVLQDKQHDRIVEELTRRRHDQLLRWYGEIDPQNDLEAEKRRFRWLVEQGALEPEEAEARIARAERLAEAVGDREPDAPAPPVH